MIGFEDIQSSAQETIYNHQDNTIEAVGLGHHVYYIASTKNQYTA